MPECPRPDSHDDTFDAEEHIQRLVKQFERRLRQEMPRGSQTLEEIEKKAHKIGREMQQKIQQEFLEAIGSGYAGAETLCDCGGAARFVACYRRQVVTVAGAGRLWRAYYHCRACKQGFCPLDAVLALGSGACSVGVRALLSRFASYLPFRTAAREMELSCGICLSASTLHREAQAVGKAIEQEWRQKEARREQEDFPVPQRRPHQLHLSMDGVMIYVEGQWREVKCAVAYESGKDEQGHAQGVAWARYYASQVPSCLFGCRMRTVAHESGASVCRRVGMLADGAEWIWQETAKHFPRSTQILDYRHAGEHLWEVARSRFGEGSEAAKAWMEQQEKRLLRDEVQEVIAAVANWPAQSEAQREVHRRATAYLQTHAHRMRYGSLRQAGWHIGSGVVESACKGVVQGRMKGRGMRWSAEGAEAMLHLRTDWCSSGHTDFTAAARRAAMAS